MKRSFLALIGTLSLPAFLLFGGCSDHDDMRTGDMQQVTSRLQAREDAHHAAVSAATDPNEIRNETNQYQTDMQAMMTEMEETCSGMMGNGMMGSSAEQTCGMTDGMMAEISSHQERITSMTDAETMQAECDEHHLAMDATLETMTEMMSDHEMMM